MPRAVWFGEFYLFYILLLVFWPILFILLAEFKHSDIAAENKLLQSNLCGCIKFFTDIIFLIAVKTLTFHYILYCVCLC